VLQIPSNVNLFTDASNRVVLHQDELYRKPVRFRFCVLSSLEPCIFFICSQSLQLTPNIGLGGHISHAMRRFGGLMQYWLTDTSVANQPAQAIPPPASSVSTPAATSDRA
jgi:hypothetical protein